MEQQLSRPAPIATASVKLVIGLFFTAIGLLMTLDNLDLINAHRYLRYWPVVFIVIGVIKIGDVTSRGFAIAMIVIGAILLALNVRALRLFDLWPLLLIGAGAFIVAQALGLRPQEKIGGWVAVLSQRKIVIDSRDFTGGRVLAFLGGCLIDLTGAEIEHGPAVIEMLVVMGGIDMRIPDGWEVMGDAVPFMGGIDIKTRSKRTGRQLVVRGFVMMGGVEITDVTARNS
ncbi:MAG TPA: DUF5668 domain-containing protein [Thermoanaerobaculia bacterium]|jgi:hypothetical protein|nr:DUF5668 domain-containing protein [Thermoanaerobaculia bacterium]